MTRQFALGILFTVLLIYILASTDTPPDDANLHVVPQPYRRAS